MLKRLTSIPAAAGLAALLAGGSAALAEENVGEPLPPARATVDTEADGGGLQFYGITVNADGTVDNPRGRVGRIWVQKVEFFDGAYRVRVVRRPDLHRRCHYTASIVSRQDMVDPPGFVSINALGSSNNGLYVTTSDADGTRADRPFALTIVCNAR